MPSTTSACPERVLIVVDRAFDPGLAEHRQALGVVDGRNVHIVTAAAPVAGERWIIDLTARERAARERLRSWERVVGRHARSTAVDVGDEHLASAVADARGALRPDRVVVVAADGPHATRRGGRWAGVARALGLAGTGAQRGSPA